MKNFTKEALLWGFAFCLLLLFSSLLHADPLDNWQWRSPLPQGNKLNAAALGGDTIVAVGDMGTVITSQDGINWTVRPTPTSHNLTGVSYGNGTFVAVGDVGTILTSQDGMNWTVQTSPASGTDLTAIAYGNNAFVAAGDFTQGIITSPDGTNWSYYSLMSYGTASFPIITYSNNAFYAMGFVNCSGWCTVDPDQAPVVYSSADGIVWTDAGSSAYPSFTGDGRGIIYGNGVYLKTSGWNKRSVSVSRDMGTWTEVSLPGNDFSLERKIYFFKGTFFVLGGPGYLASSTDGVNWKMATSSPLERIRSISFGNGGWVAAGDKSIYSSTDGMSWTPQYSTDGGGYYLTAVAYGNNRFVAAGLYNAVLTSPDGRQWSKATLGFSLNDVTFGNGLFAGASGNNLVTSPDGINWAVRESYPPKDYTGTRFFRIIFGNGTFAALGYDNELTKDVVCTSTDGISWTRHALDTGYWNTVINDISYGNNAFLIVGDSGYVYRSSDGANWSKTQAGAPIPGGGISYNDRYRVAYGDGLFVSAGAMGDIQSSPDGITWTRRKSLTRDNLYYISYANHTFLVSSEGGEVLQSGRFDTPTPPPFSFTEQTNVGVNTVITSNPIVVSDLSATAPISVIDGAYSINGGTYTNADGTVNNGDSVTVRQTSSANYATATNTTLIIGGSFANFRVTTETAPIALTVIKSGPGTGTIISVPPGIDCGADCMEYYASSTSVTLTAQASAGSIFTGWSGGLCSGTGTCILQVDGAKNVTATFIDRYGDISGDGAATIMDAIRALQLLTEKTPAPIINSDASINGDGKIGLPEAIYILQKAAGLR